MPSPEVPVVSVPLLPLLPLAASGVVAPLAADVPDVVAGLAIFVASPGSAAHATKAPKATLRALYPKKRLRLICIGKVLETLTVYEFSCASAAKQTEAEPQTTCPYIDQVAFTHSQKAPTHP